MKRTSPKILAAIFLLTLAVAPLRAQTNLSAESGMSNVAAAVSETQPVANVSSSTDAAATQEPHHKTKRFSESFGEESELPGLKGLGILIPLAPFVMVVAIIGVVFYFKHRRNQMMNETLRSMIEKGMPITPELVESLKTKRPVPTDFLFGSRPRNDIRLGLILVGVGAGVVMLAGKPGWIVLFIGVAYLAVGLFDRNNSGNQPPQPPTQTQ